MKRSGVFAAVLLLMMTVASAQEGGTEKYYLGGGFGSSTAPESEVTQSAMQFFAGYSDGMEWLDHPHYNFSIEGGCTDVSDYQHDSCWVMPVVSRYINSYLDIVLRAGVEFGDDTGPIGALGFEYKIDHVYAVRLEMIERSKSQAALINLVYRP